MAHVSCSWLKTSAVLAAFALAATLACGSTSTGGTGGTTGTITISGQLVAGTVTTPPHALIQATSSSALATPLVGYKLYCVTFQSPPVAGSGTADSSGNVSVTLAAQNVAFGCFVQDTSGNTVATLSFHSSSTTGTTLTASGDTSLGAIQVDTSTGLATATVSSGTVASTPAGATCPTGYWIFQTGASDCSTTLGQATTAQVWVTPAVSGGGYTVSIIHGPSNLHNGTCGFESFTSTATYSNGVLTVASFNSNPGSTCPQTLAIVITPDSTCTTATAAGTFHGCGTCGTSTSNVCGGNNSVPCGTLTCNATWQGAKTQ